MVFSARFRRGIVSSIALAIVLLGLMLPQPAPALDRLEFDVAGGDEALAKSIRAASLLVQQKADGATDPQDLFAAARADYGRILGTLYAQGRYGAEISIRIDGREAADIAALNAPSSIGVIRITVDPGPEFTFSSARIAPLPAGARQPEDFRRGRLAASTAITAAVDESILAWREVGHAKAAVASEDVVADHRTSSVAAEIGIDPGPALRFGRLSVSGQERMRTDRIIKIAGLKYGEPFSQSELDRAAQRLRRSGVFRSVTLTEADFPVSPDLLPIAITVAEEKTRRYSIGAEVASLDGLSLSGYWLHRNLFGGAERLKIDGAITNIGAGSSGIDYQLGLTLDRPATFSADTTAGLMFSLGHLDEVDYAADLASAGLQLTHYFSDTLTVRAGLTYDYAEGRDPGGKFRFRNLSLPLGVTWDRRDRVADARKGFYLDAEAKPFLGLGTTGSGVRLAFDGRVYRSLGRGDHLTFAARVQGGAVLGSDLLETPRDALFFSGGGGTVRGQPYRSLGIAVNRGFGSDFLIGGTYMLAASAEIRTRITEKIGVVAFYDVGRVGVDGFFDSLGSWHAGAGLGLRYETGFGPLRLDIAAPVHGSTGDGVQFYLGLGQSF